MSARNSKNERPLAAKPPAADGPREHDVQAEERLIRQCLAGDGSAWERLYRKYHPRLRRAIGLL
ncbi:MAG: hypothetical protein ABIP48_32445, partial [Planctomycetota bacterium]